MRYYLMDTAGRFLSPNLKFDTYDHNHALKFSDYMEAKKKHHYNIVRIKQLPFEGIIPC